jgi:arylsulfatase A-like enzyme
VKPVENYTAFRISFWQIFSLVFVLFSLYLMGDAFSRWDGFSYYASFAEFLPGVSLAFVLWSLVAVFLTIAVFMALKLFEWISSRTKSIIRVEHLLFLTGFFILFGAVAWKGKRLMWPDVETTMNVKMAVFICVTLSAVFFTVITRNRAVQWFNLVLERLTPLVWIFGLFFCLSVLLVAYLSCFKDVGRELAVKNEQTYPFDQGRPNIILVTFDALAAREMSLYGYHIETTPFISMWAENATVFSQAQAASNFTASTTASLMTGKRVWTHQTYHIEGSKPLKSETESLPFLLKDYGYFNVALVVNPFASVRILGMDQSFDITPRASEFSTSASLFGWKFGIIDVMLYRAFGDKIRLHNWIIRNDFILSKFLNLISRNISQTTVPPEKAFNHFMRIVDNDIPKPFFAWIHLFPPHDPYLPPEPFVGRFDSSTEMRTYKLQEKSIEYSYKYLFQYQPLPDQIMPVVKLLRKYYDEFIAYIDHQFEDFIAEINKREINNTIIIFTADHGESFDHGYFTHGGPFLYEQVTHIPLIIKEPGQNKGYISNTLVEQIDIPATVLDFAGIPVPSWIEGRSLVPLMRGETLSGQPAFSMNFEENRSRGNKITKGSIAVWKDDYKLIHYLDKNTSVLFNLKSDPNELNDLFEKEQEKGNSLLQLILSNLRLANEKISSEKP